MFHTARSRERAGTAFYIPADCVLPTFLSYHIRAFSHTPKCRFFLSRTYSALAIPPAQRTMFICAPPPRPYRERNPVFDTRSVDTRARLSASPQKQYIIIQNIEHPAILHNFFIFPSFLKLCYTANAARKISVFPDLRHSTQHIAAF